VTLRDYTDAAAAAIGCDPALVALPALAVVAGCVGNSRAIQLRPGRRGWTEPAVVWAITVVRSGGVKSAGFDAAVGPLQDHGMDEWEKYQAEKEQARKNGDPEPPRPPCQVTGDANIESVGELLRDNPHGILLARDELDGWFQGFTRYKRSAGATDRPHWLELHGARTLRLDRITRERGPLVVRRACCSICGTIQPRVLARALDAEALAAGLGARFLLAMPPVHKRVWTERQVAEELADRYARLLADLLALPPGDKGRPERLQLSGPAKGCWVRWFNQWGERQYAALDAEAAVLAKIEGYAARLILQHHVVSHVAVGSADICPIGERSVAAGIRLAEWFAAEAGRVYQVIHETDVERRQRELAEWVQRRGGETTARELCRSRPAHYPRVEDAAAALDELAAAGRGGWYDRPAGPQGGRPTRFFRARADEAGRGFGRRRGGQAQGHPPEHPHPGAGGDGGRGAERNALPARPIT
jgi:hypothetical protein